MFIIFPFFVLFIPFVTALCEEGVFHRLVGHRNFSLGFPNRSEGDVELLSPVDALWGQ